MAEGRGRRGKPRFVRIKRSPTGPLPGETVAEQNLQATVSGARQAPEDRETHTRIVIPRQDRRLGAAAERSDADIELREVRYGATSHLPYLRIVPRQRRFLIAARGHLVATPLASRPVDILGRYWADIRAVVIGSPFATSQAIHERLTKVKALAVLSSDALSSSAYATEEILLMLMLAGSAALTQALPIAGVIALVLVVVALSYRQTIRAYPGGGAAYIVAHENLGRKPALLAASSIMVDYVLTAAVSVAAGVAAITSAVPDLHDLRVPIGVAILALLTLGNSRGLRESGTLFAIPTYFFIVGMAMVIVVGLTKVLAGDAPGSLLHAAPPRQEVAAIQGLSLFLILRAFSSGSAALTGVEAIANGVPLFKPPESQNARAVQTSMAAILIFLFIGITFLSSRYGLVPSEGETVVSLLGREILGENVLYYGYQVVTALVLLLAANTSFNAFPLMSAILARDRFMPQQFAFKGDRLAYSNGIILLAAAASVLLIAFGGEVTRLIPLYAVGVFVSFTLSQSGMVRRWWRLRGPAWRASLALNGVGAAATAVVAIIIATTKFTHGAWISILLMALLMALFALIRRHYDQFERDLQTEAVRMPVAAPAATAEPPPQPEHVVVPVEEIDRASLGAVEFARKLSEKVTAVHITDDTAEADEFRTRWGKTVPDVPLLVIESPYRAFVAPMLAYLESLERAEPDTRIVLVLPRLVLRHWWERLLHNQDALRLKPHLRRLPRVRVVDFPYGLAAVAHVPR